MILDVDFSHTVICGWRMMRRSQARLGLLFAALLALGTARAAEPPILVGAVISESGNLADLAADLRKSLLLWQEEVNGSGGLLGRRIELRLLDDRSEAAAAADLYERLIRDERCDVLIGRWVRHRRSVRAWQPSATGACS
jgi:branched-chain amino acid transport system substrate-binding protein